MSPKTLPATPPQAPATLLGETYKLMRQGDYDVPDSYDAFEQQATTDPQYVADLHALFKEEKWTAPDKLNDFRQELLAGVKKKPALATPPVDSLPSGGVLPSALGSDLGLGAALSGSPATDQQFAEVGPGAPPLPVLTDAPTEQRLSPLAALEKAPGDEYLAAGVPLPSGEDLRAEEEAASLANLALLRGSTNGDVRPVVDRKALGKALPPLAYGQERVVIPAGHQGVVPPNTYADPETGLRFFDRALSTKADGQEQGALGGAAALFKNSLIEMGQGLVEGVGALANATSGLPYDAAPDAVSQRMEGAKAAVSDLNARQPLDLAHPSTILMKSAEYGPLIVAQVAQTLAPELRAPAAVSKILGLVSTVGFDAQMVHGAAEHAKAAGLTGKDAALYTVLEGALTIGGFKAGSKLMGALGDKLARKLAPDALREQVAADAVARVRALEAQTGRTATQAETSAALHESLRAALPGLAQVPKEMLQQAPTFAGVEGLKIAANQLAAPALGGQADNLTPEQMLAQVGGAAGEGLVMGAVTGATSAVLGGLARSGTVGGAALPAENQGPEAAAPEASGEPPALPRTVPLGPGSTGEPMFAELSPEGQVVRVHTADGAEADLQAWGPWLEKNLPTKLAEADAPAPAPAAAEPSAEPVSLDAPADPLPAAEPAPAPAPPAGFGPVSAEPPAPAPAPTAATPPPADGAPTERLPAAEPHPDHAQPLTPAQQAVNATLDALDGYNALGTREKKGKAGSAARAELARLGKAAGLDVQVGNDFGVKVTRGGKRVTRANEYTATTPANNPVPLAERPAAVRPFLEQVVAAADGTPGVVQGLGIELRGKPLGGPELQGALDDIKAGRNTLRAQLTLDALENAHRRGFVEKSEGTGLATRKYSIPVEEFVGGGAPAEAAAQHERPITDAEIDALLAQAPQLDAALADYTDLATGGLNYAKLAQDGRALPFLFEVPDDIALQITTLARERAQSPTNRQQPTASETDPGSEAPGLPPSPGPAAAGPGVAPAAGTEAVAAVPAATRARGHAQRYSEETQAALTGEEKSYAPAAAQLAANESPAAFIQRVGADAAYEAALAPRGDQEALLHNRLIKGVRAHYEAARTAALAAGKPAVAEQANEQVLRLTGRLARAGTEAAQALQDFAGAADTIGRLVQAVHPADAGQATVDSAFGAIAQDTEAKQAENDHDGAALLKKAIPARRQKMADVLASAAVQAAVEKAVRGPRAAPAPRAEAPEPTGYGAGNKVFTKKGLGELRTRLKNTAFAAPLPPDLVYLAGYHVEAGARRFVDFAQKMVRELGERVRPHLPALYEAATREVVGAGANAAGFDSPAAVRALVAEQAAPSAVRAGVHELGKRLVDIAKQHAADLNEDRRTLTKKFVEDAGLSGPAAGEMAAAIEKEWNRRVEKGAWQALGQRFQPRRSRAKADAFDRLVNDLNAAANLPESPQRNPAGQLLDQLLGDQVRVGAAEADHIQHLKDAYVAAAQKTVQRIGGKMVETTDTRRATTAAIDLLRVLGQLKNVGQSDWAQKSQALYYASLLSGPYTHLANAYLNAIATGHEVGLISTLHTWAATGSLRTALAPLGGLGAGYRRGAAEAQHVLATGYDGDTKTGARFTDASFDSDPLETASTLRGGAVRLLHRLGLGRGLAVPDQSAARYVRRALGASDTFFQGGLAEARARELAVKLATQRVARDQRAGVAVSRQRVRQLVADEADKILFNTPEALADIAALVDREGLVQPKTAAAWAARQARLGDLLDQARASAHPELVADAQAFAARHAGNSDYEGHMGAWAHQFAGVMQNVPVLGKLLMPFSRVVANFQARHAEWFGLGFYRAVRGGAGQPLLGGQGLADRYRRAYTPEEQEKAFLRSTLGVVATLGAYALVKQGLIQVTGPATGDKEQDQQTPPMSIICRGAAWSYKGQECEIPLLALAQTMAWAKAMHLKGDDPDLAQKLGMVGVFTVVATANTGPTNGVAEFAGALSEAQRHPDQLIGALKRLAVSGAKTAAAPAALTQLAQLYNVATDAALPEKRSTDAWHQLQLQVFGDVPVWHGGAEAALDQFGDPLHYASNRFWGVRPVAADPIKDAAKVRLAELGIDTGNPRPADYGLRLFDPVSGTQATALSDAEFRQYAQARGKGFWKELTRPAPGGATPALAALLHGTPAEAEAAVKEALKFATADAKQLVLDQRIRQGQEVRFGKPHRVAGGR
ncbi:hypothetical protein [Hymenobacter sp. PAMC 26628]|uniref:hypothetical protein n=1 Tax=Hymenobacter sp. PAMC 26628 TaxID=1484118 RepID=UPI000770444A|nr:hypothetical protein [Hymenobacter sp. PAMC 26628]AMJ67192.1 hypothetical protein AXW84_18475 [Hymenobacter sp. PAMC 26628]